MERDLKYSYSVNGLFNKLDLFAAKKALRFYWRAFFVVV